MTTHFKYNTLPKRWFVNKRLNKTSANADPYLLNPPPPPAFTHPTVLIHTHKDTSHNLPVSLANIHLNVKIDVFCNFQVCMTSLILSLSTSYNLFPSLPTILLHLCNTPSSMCVTSFKCFCKDIAILTPCWRYSIMS